MKLSAPSPAAIPLRNNKLPNSWKRLVKFLKFIRLKKPLFVRAFIQSRGSKSYEPPASASRSMTTGRRRRRKRGVVRLISKLQCLKATTKDIDNIMNMKSFSDDAGGGGGYSIKEPFPSPLTPVYVRLLSAAPAAEAAANKNSDDEEILSCGDQQQQDQEEDMKMMMEEDAIKSFEKYMFEMVVEDGAILANLEDVQELLYHWNTLKCPVFVALVSRFYAELCMDLFSNPNNNQLTL